MSRRPPRAGPAAGRERVPVSRPPAPSVHLIQVSSVVEEVGEDVPRVLTVRRCIPVSPVEKIKRLPRIKGESWGSPYIAFGIKVRVHSRP